jgi:hypothetical protein
MRCVIGLVALCFGASVQAMQCAGQTGARTAALVELYTSQGCSSCPPADRWLSAIGAAYPRERVVPLALHVDYWDYIGWKDGYAKREFSLRQRKLSQLQKLALVYTPQVLLQGRDFRGWGSAAFDAALARINAQPAKASVRLEILNLGPSIEVNATAELSDLAQRHDAALYLAAYESKLETRVLEWQGPFGFAGAARLMERRSLPLLPQAVPAHSGAVAFVQNRRTTEVLQVLALPACE